MMGLACLFMVACNNAPKQEQKPDEQPVVAEEHHCPFCPLKAEYANWDNMDETAKAELNKKAYDLFAQMDAKCAEQKAECGEKKECCEKKAECGEKKECAEQKAECGEKKECCEKKAECGEKKECAEQKAECGEKKECCEKKAKCAADWANFENLTLDEQKDVILCRIAAMGMGGDQCQHEAEAAHQCQHEGEGHQCQHGEGHQCDHAK